MNRLLLTFLALLAGLLAQGAPAQARDVAAGTSQIGAMEVPMAKVVASAQVQAGVGPVAARVAPVEKRCCRKPTHPALFQPTVQIGIDRARE